MRNISKETKTAFFLTCVALNHSDLKNNIPHYLQVVNPMNHPMVYLYIGPNVVGKHINILDFVDIPLRSCLLSSLVIACAIYDATKTIFRYKMDTSAEIVLPPL